MEPETENNCMQTLHMSEKALKSWNLKECSVFIKEYGSQIQEDNIEKKKVKLPPSRRRLSMRKGAIKRRKLLKVLKIMEVLSSPTSPNESTPIVHEPDNSIDVKEFIQYPSGIIDSKPNISQDTSQNCIKIKKECTENYNEENDEENDEETYEYIEIEMEQLQNCTVKEEGPLKECNKIETEHLQNYKDMETRHPQNCKEIKTEPPENYEEIETEYLQNYKEIKTEPPENYEEIETEHLKNYKEMKTKRTQNCKEIKTEPPENYEKIETEHLQNYKEMKTKHPQNCKKVKTEDPKIYEELEIEHLQNYKEMKTKYPQNCKKAKTEDPEIYEEIETVFLKEDYEVETTQSQNCNQTKKTKNHLQKDKLDGRCIVNFPHLLSEIHRIFDNHAQGIECHFRDWKHVNTCRSGLLTKFFFKCQMCNYEDSILSEPKETDALDINSAAITAGLEVGMGYAKLRKFYTKLNIPCMSENTYIKLRNIVNKNDSIKDSEKMETVKKK